MSRSGRRLSNAIKKANRKERKKKSKPLPIYSHSVSPGYVEIHIAIKNYIRHYIDAYHSKKSYVNLIHGSATRSLYVREPIGDCDLTLDIHKITYEQDWCTIAVRFHKGVPSRRFSTYGNKYTFATPLYFKKIFADPNFFPLLCVFLDECVLTYWGCDPFAKLCVVRGGLIELCVSDLERMLVHDANDSRIVEIERSNGSFDEPSAFDVRMNGSSVGILSALDGNVRFQNQRITIQKTAAWIVDGHTYGFAKLVAEGIRHDNSSSCNAGFYPVSQGAE